MKELGACSQLLSRSLRCEKKDGSVFMSFHISQSSTSVLTRLAVLPLAIALLCSGAPQNIRIHTQDSLSLKQGIYSALYFVAEPARAPNSELPMQYQLTGSGATPPGMKFEPYPCNKPGMKVCPQVATSNGVYLDGVPQEAGSYSFVIIAIDADERRASQEFTVVVNPPDAAK